MTIDSASFPEPRLTTLPAKVDPPASTVLVSCRSWLPLPAICRIVGRMTEEMTMLVTERALHRRDRRRTMWHVRQIAMYVCHVALQIPVTDVADAFGRNRSTVAYALRIVENRRDDKAYDDFVEAVERMARSVFASGEAGDA
jgi:hypothetical protein